MLVQLHTSNMKYYSWAPIGTPRTNLRDIIYPYQCTYTTYTSLYIVITAQN